jgi:manganese transport protein
VFLVLGLQRRGVRQFESLIIALVALIGTCFAVQIWWLQPSAAAVAAGFIPTAQLLSSPQMLYFSVGIIGATVMPHNLYLHSSLVKTRQHERCERGIRQAIRYATLDSNVALAFALFVNVGIMVLAAGAFHRANQPPVATLEDAYNLLSPLLGVAAASTVFGIALIASGLSSSVTGTLAGQVVMEGFLDIRMSRIKRAMLTRCLAIGPALAIAATLGSAGVGRLLVFSQVILGLQLPFAVVPLLWFTTRRKHLGAYAFAPLTGVVLWSVAGALILINVWVIHELS